MPSGRVLVIDGEIDSRRAIVKGLSATGFEVHACRDGVSAIHELEHSHHVDNRFDYIVAGAFLQDISGLKILKVLKADYPELPVVIASRYGDGTLREKVLEYSNTGYIDKPFEADALVAELAKLKPAETTEDHTHLGSPIGLGQEGAKAFLAIKITDPSVAQAAFNSLRELQGVTSVDAVRGNMDIIATCWQDTREGLDALLTIVAALSGIEVQKVNHVAATKLDKDVSHFIGDYNYALELTQVEDQEPEGPFGYLLVDVDPAEVQAIFTTMYFIDEVLTCEVVNGGNRIIAYCCEVNGKSYGRRVKQLDEINGVLRVREAAVFDLFDE